MRNFVIALYLTAVCMCGAPSLHAQEAPVSTLTYSLITVDQSQLLDDAPDHVVFVVDQILFDTKITLASNRLRWAVSGDSLIVEWDPRLIDIERISKLPLIVRPCAEQDALGLLTPTTANDGVEGVLLLDAIEYANVRQWSISIDQIDSYKPKDPIVLIDIPGEDTVILTVNGGVVTKATIIKR